MNLRFFAIPAVRNKNEILRKTNLKFWKTLRPVNFITAKEKSEKYYDKNISQKILTLMKKYFYWEVRSLKNLKTNISGLIKFEKSYEKAKLKFNLKISQK